MSYREGDGRADGIGDAPVEEAHGMGSSKKNDVPLAHHEVPLNKPQLLEDYRHTGHELIRLHHPRDRDQEGRPIGKAPYKGWRQDVHLTVDEAAAHMAEGGNVGVRLRPCDLVVDVDPRNFLEGDDPYRRLQDDLGVDFTDYPRVITGSGGYHVYMLKPEHELLRDSLEAYQGVEFKTLGRQVVSAGSVHPDALRPYEWDPDPLAVTLAEVRDAPASLVELTRRPERIAAADAGDVSPEKLSEMLEGLDARMFSDHAKWLALMMACHHATAGEGRDEFLGWSTTDPEYQDQAWSIGRRWDSLHADQDGRRVTQRTLFKALIDAGRQDLIPRHTAEEDFADDLPAYEGVQSRSQASAELEEVNATHFTVLTAGKYLVGREGVCPFQGHTSVEWFPDVAVQKHLDSRSVVLPDGARKPLGSWWVKHPRRRQYDGVIFDPAPGADHPRLYNLWRGWSVEPEAGDWSLMKRLMSDVLCGGDHANLDYVLKWAAFMVQHPNAPAEVALVFKGQKGVGKGTFARALKDLAGQHGRQVAQADHFTGRFNDHLNDTILLFVDEGLWAGDRKAEGALKNLITEPTLSFEGKNKPIVSGPNRLHVVIASNEDWVIPASPDERRFAVFEADGVARAALPAGFFEELNRQMREGGAAAMLHELQHIDIADWHPRSHVPATRALTQQKVQGFRNDPIAFWWHRALEDGDLSGGLGVAGWPEGFDVDSAAKDGFVAALEAQARAMGRRAEFTKHAVARFLSRVGIDVTARDRRGGKVWRVPPLAAARQCFETLVGGQVDWD
ncbi:DUF5906 domain-containing protein [Sphingomonas sp. R86521]|uniref:DUF5906 domain-containing protein n=1 Tax=Sphingomonas sp. R86521 TaxID=3093860 RepID=UPI0036D2ABF0